MHLRVQKRPRFAVSVGLVAAALALTGTAALAGASEGPSASVRSSAAPAGSTGNSFSSVTCASTGNCVAVGQLGVQGGGAALVDVETSGVWKYASTPVPKDANTSSPDNLLDAAACASATSCVAVGYYANVTKGVTYQQALIEDDTAGSWSAVSAPLPAGASTSPLNSLDAVSCTSAGNCTAVGSYLDAAGEQDALLDVETNGVWSSAPASLPSDADLTNPDDLLSAVSCTTNTDCVAVGSYVNHNAASTCPNKDCLQVLLDVETAGTWTSVTAPLPTNGTPWPLNGNSLSDVACTSSSNCVAVGSYEDAVADSRPLIDVETAGTWAFKSAPLPLDHSAVPVIDSFTSVSCVSQGNCVAVGQYDNKTEAPEGLIDTQTNGVWTPATAPVPSDANLVMPDVLLTSVSCVSLTSCVAVGSYETPPIRNLSPLALLDAEVDGVWMAGTVDLPGDASTTGPYNTLNDVACTSPWSCVAVGVYVDDQGNYQLILDTLGVALTTLPVVPGPPNTVFATVGHAQASVGWLAPASNGGSPVTSYTVTASPGGARCTTTGALRCRVWPLSGNTNYTFSVVAANKVGRGPSSTISAAVTTLPAINWTATIGSFAQSSFHLTAPLHNELVALAQKVVANGDDRIAITGYSDNTGSPAQINVISHQRAAVVEGELKAQLHALHANGVTFTLTSRGDANPVASNKTAAGRARNRRVVLKLT